MVFDYKFYTAKIVNFEIEMKKIYEIVIDEKGSNLKWIIDPEIVYSVIKIKFIEPAVIISK